METTQPLPDRSAYPAPSTDAITYDEFLRRNTAAGTLKVQASRARGALPTPDVRISVIGRFADARVLFFDGVTDGRRLPQRRNGPPGRFVSGLCQSPGV